MSKETKIILDELNYSIGKLNEKVKSGHKLKDSQFWYRKGLLTAKNIVLQVDELTK